MAASERVSAMADALGDGTWREWTQGQADEVAAEIDRLRAREERYERLRRACMQARSAHGVTHPVRVALDALDREEREAAPASGDPELAAAVARLDGAQAGGHLMKRGVLWRGIVADGRLHIGTLRDVLIALAWDVSEEGR